MFDETRLAFVNDRMMRFWKSNSSSRRGRAGSPRPVKSTCSHGALLCSLVVWVLSFNQISSLRVTTFSNEKASIFTFRLIGSLQLWFHVNFCCCANLQFVKVNTIAVKTSTVMVQNLSKLIRRMLRTVRFFLICFMWIQS